MMKFYRILLLTLIVSLCLAFPTMAATMPRLVDDADLLTDAEEAELIVLLDEISERQQMDVVVVTASSLGGKRPMAYADDFFDYNGYGYGASRDGVLLLVSMEDRDWWISTSGYGIATFTDAGIDALGDCFLSDLSAGFYADAFETFAKESDYYITQAYMGQPVGMYDEAFDPSSSFLVAAVIGLLGAFFVTGTMKGQLKSVRQQTAGAYLKNGSFHLTDSREMFLYRNVTRTVKQSSSSSSTHTSSSGRSHGGGGGKF